MNKIFSIQGPDIFLGEVWVGEISSLPRTKFRGILPKEEGWVAEIKLPYLEERGILYHEYHSPPFASKEEAIANVGWFFNRWKQQVGWV